MITLAQTNFPPQSTPVIDEHGNMTIPGTNFWKALWLRTGGGTGIPNQLGTALTGAGTTQADALALMADWNEVTTAATNSGVLLPTLTGGQPCVVFNRGAHTLKVYPPSLAQIDALGANAAYSLASLKTQIFWFLSAAQIYSTQLG